MKRKKFFSISFLLGCTFLFIGASELLAAQPQVAVGVDHTVGLKFDGTVVAVGSNLEGQLNVGGWTDICNQGRSDKLFCKGHP